MKSFLTFITIYLLLVTPTNAQDLPSIQTDRPDQTECPFITPKHYFQIESGFSYEKVNDNSNGIVAPTLLTKYGVNDYFELRLITEFIISNEYSNRYSGINPILIGFKTRLLKEKGLLPTTSIIVHFGIPKAASPDYRAKYYYPEFRFTMQHTISEKQTLSYNLGAEWNGLSSKPTYIYTLTSGYSFTDKIGGYIEFYGFFPQSQKPDNRFDAGFTYLINPNQQLDLSGGIGITKTSPDHYIAIGYSFRFKIK